MDILEFMNMEPFYQPDQVFNIPLAIYSDGSYFGDNDVLLTKNGYRSSTAIANHDS